MSASKINKYQHINGIVSKLIMSLFHALSLAQGEHGALEKSAFHDSFIVWIETRIKIKHKYCRSGVRWWVSELAGAFVVYREETDLLSIADALVIRQLKPNFCIQKDIVFRRVLPRGNWTHWAVHLHTYACLTDNFVYFILHMLTHYSSLILHSGRMYMIKKHWSASVADIFHKLVYYWNIEALVFSIIKESYHQLQFIHTLTPHRDVLKKRPLQWHVYIEFL